MSERYEMQAVSLCQASRITSWKKQARHEQGWVQPALEPQIIRLVHHVFVNQTLVIGPFDGMISCRHGALKQTTTLTLGQSFKPDAYSHRGVRAKKLVTVQFLWHARLTC